MEVSKYGGKREGAGRPKGTTKENKKVYKTFSVSCLEHELALIKSNAKKQGKTPSRYLVDLALQDKKQSQRRRKNRKIRRSLNEDCLEDSGL